ncbi:MAG: AEC family transporter [Magnetospirillum sp.]|nr:AEC family transporter [Magnetospirillum sp.]
MSAIVGALSPIFLLIVMGWAFRVRGWLTDSFWVPAEKLTYYVLFPALLVANLAEARLDGLPVAAILGAQGGAVLIVAALAALVATLSRRPPLALDGPAASSLFQGMIRPNTYVGLATAAGLFGLQGLTLTALCVALVVPMGNVLAVLGLVHWAHPKTGGRGWRALVRPIVTNPMILSCAAGMALNLGGVGLPPVVGPLFKILGQAALTLGLLAVGAGLEPRAVRAGGPAVALALLGKLAAMPALVAALAWTLGVRGLPFAVCVVFAGLPVAPNSYVLARQLGGDARLMAAIITLSTLVAAATLTAMVLLVH